MQQVRLHSVESLPNRLQHLRPVSHLVAYMCCAYPKRYVNLMEPFPISRYGLLLDGERYSQRPWGIMGFRTFADLPRLERWLGKYCEAGIANCRSHNGVQLKPFESCFGGFRIASHSVQYECFTNLCTQFG